MENGWKPPSESEVDAARQAALALTAVIADPGGIRGREAVEFTLEAPDPEILLVDWLNALIFEMATRRMLFCRFELEIRRNHLSGKAWGEKIEVGRHRPAAEVKGATFCELEVACMPGGTWRAQCVVDV